MSLQIFAYLLWIPESCLAFGTHQTVALDTVRRPKTAPIHERQRYMRCNDCSEVRGYPHKRG